MNTATLLLILQATASLLSGAQNNTTMSSSTTAQLVALGSRTVQIVTQASAKIDFTVAENSSTWPNLTELLAAPYLDAGNNYVQQGSTVKLDQGSISFGDLNNDGLDDAAAIVERTTANGATEHAIAAFINQGGIMFNVADLSLGTLPVTIYSHHVVSDGVLSIDMQTTGQSRATTTYSLLGNQIFKNQ